MNQPGPAHSAVAEPDARPLSERALALMHRMRRSADGSVVEARDLRREALGHLPDPDAHRAIALCDLIIASVALHGPDERAVMERLDRVLRYADDFDDVDARVRALRLMSLVHWNAGRDVALNRALHQAYEASKQLDNERLQATIGMDVARARDRIGQHQRALDILDEVAPLYFRTRPEVPSWNQALVTLHRASMLNNANRPREAKDALDAYYEAWGLRDTDTLDARFAMTYAYTMRRIGLPRSIATMARVAEMATGFEQQQVRFSLLLECAHEAANQDPAGALRWIDEALAMQSERADARHVDELLALQVDCARRAGDIATALEASEARCKHLQKVRDSERAAAASLLDRELAYHDLQRSFRRTTQRANELSRIVDQLTQLQSDVHLLVHDAVHDLGGPLTALEFATERLETIQSQGGDDSLGYLRSAVDSIRDIVAGLADQRRSPPAEKATTPLARACRLALPTFEAMAAVKGSAVALDSDTERDVHGRRSEVVRIVGNLVSNAIKYSPPDSRIRLVVRDRGHHIELAVHDAGPGFPHGFIDSIERGHTGHAAPTAGESSTGLGLAIVQRFCTRYRASIAFDTDADGGVVRVGFRAK